MEKSLELTEQQKLDQKKSNLINDLVALTNVMSEVWKYHPNNPNQVSVVDEYASLVMLKEGIEEELQNFN
jgi:hypothetical protein